MTGGGWTTETALVHLAAMIEALDRRNEQRFVDLEKTVESSLESARAAVSKAEAAQDKRMDSMNEFRGQLADQTATLLTRTEYDVAHSGLVERISDVSSRLARIEGRSGGLASGWAYLAGALALMVSIVSVVVAIITH